MTFMQITLNLCALIACIGCIMASIAVLSKNLVPARYRLKVVLCHTCTVLLQVATDITVSTDITSDKKKDFVTF